MSANPTGGFAPQERRQRPRDVFDLDADGHLEWLDERPRTRAECIDAPRPCPWVSCRYHLATWVANYRVRCNSGLEEWDETTPTCALDVTDDNPGGLTMELVGELVGVNRRRVHQIEKLALEKLARAAPHLEGLL